MAEVLDTDVVVRGCQSPLPAPGTIFSGSYGRTLEEAAGAVTHGTVRATTVRALRAGGGTVDHTPEAAYIGGPINERYVNVVEGPGPTTFSDPFPNPVPKRDRVPGRPSQ